MKLKGSQAIIKVLVEQGVDTVFGYPGGQVIPLYDALYDAPLRNVLTAHEQGAIHAADGYARASGKVGVCIATSGPGATNIVTGLATAYLDSVPLVAITGQVPVNNLGRDSFQEIDIVGVTVPITKYNALVRRSEDLVPTLRKAFAIAKEGRPGPVLVDVPSNLQAAELEWPELETEKMEASASEASAEEGNEGIFAAAAELLNKAVKPVLLVGGGALNSDAGAELVELAAKADLPIVNTLMGVGVVPASNKRSLGMTGMHGHIASNMAVVHTDVLVVAGSRFTERVTGDRTRYVGKKTIIQLDIDPSEIDKNIAVSVPLVGDIKKSLQKLLPLIKEAKHEAWWKQVKAWDASEDRSLEKGDHLTAPWLMKHLSAAMGADAVYVTDVGQNQMWAAQHLVVDKPRHHLTSGGCGTMGFGLPAALGAAFAVGDKPVVQICGDGGFKMTGMELYTACRENKKLISIVINNSCLGMVRQWQPLFYDKRYSAAILSEFDLIRCAPACGAEGVQATTCEEFAAALEKAKAAKKPFLIEAIIEQGDIVEPMVAPGAVLDDFVKVAK